MTGGWRTQWERMQRWYKRATLAQNSIDRYDLLYAFFEKAFHLRDWLIDTGAANSKDLGDLFDQNVEMRLCRDLANSHKHFSLSQPSQQLPPSEAHEYSPGAGNLDDDVSLVILSDGVKHDAFVLAQQILERWKTFLKASVAPSKTG